MSTLEREEEVQEIPFHVRDLHQSSGGELVFYLKIAEFDRVLPFFVCVFDHA